MTQESLPLSLWEQDQKTHLSWEILRSLSDSTSAILKLEKDESYIAYIQLLETLRQSGHNESILQEVHKL